MFSASSSRRIAPHLVLAALLTPLASCGEAPAPAGDPQAAEEASPAASVAGEGVAQAGGPPLGRYVCRQYMTTMGYLTLEPGGEYEVSGVRGRYLYDPETGAMNWEGGSYDEWGWEGTYEEVVRPEGDGRPDEHVIRLVSEADGLKIDCFETTEE